MSSWGWFYKLGFDAAGDPLRAAGVKAIKRELIYNGYDGGGIIADKPTFGGNAVTATKEFQADHGLTADGIVGPDTARHLFRKRIAKAELDHGIPNHLVGKLVHLESNDDPVAIGTVDPGDFGLGQIHLSSHPEVTEAEAIDPSFAVPWVARYLAGLYTATGSVDYDLALAAYNAGTDLAIRWGNAGKPASGGPKLHDGRDAWQVLTKYVQLVHAAAY
jgi:hypothetical protein